MSFKRFFQLFVFYALSIVISYAVVVGFKITSHLGIISTMIVVGYLVLGLPLTLLSLKKNYKK